MNPRELLGRIRRPPPARPGEVNYPFLDRFTLAHLGIGVGYELAGLSFAASLLLALAWELIENPLKAHAKWIFPHATADTFRNSLGDTLAVCAGWALVKGIRIYFGA